MAFKIKKKTCHANTCTKKLQVHIKENYKYATHFMWCSCNSEPTAKQD